MHSLPPIYRCRACGATSYMKLTHRGADGVMHYSGMYRCSGCELTFVEPAAWRDRRRRPRSADVGTPVDDERGTASEHGLGAEPRGDAMNAGAAAP